ncbi:MAG: FG-GAP-like repeat-containing protein [Pseudomonadota bacterium]
MPRLISFLGQIIAGMLICCTAQAATLEGTWNSTFGELRIIEDRKVSGGRTFFYGYYAKVGFVTGYRKGRVARGVFVHANQQSGKLADKSRNLGLFEWTLDHVSSTWEGNWTWGGAVPKSTSQGWNASRAGLKAPSIERRLRTSAVGYLFASGSDSVKWINAVQQASAPALPPPGGLTKAIARGVKPFRRNAPPQQRAEATDSPENCKGQFCTIKQGLNVKRDALWPDQPIPVCWENPLVDNQQGRAWTQAAVQRSWAAVSKVNFTDWSGCPNGDYDGIRVRVEDTGPHAKALGRNLSGVRDGIVLNFTFQNWSSTCQRRLQYCIETIAVHEFGHALGFAHDHNEEKANFVGCTDQPQGTNGDWQVTAFDLQSVMNYCNTNWAGDGMLSKLDISGVRRLYGHNLTAYYSVGGVSHEGEGAGVATWDLDGNGMPEMILLAQNAPSGPNDFRYRVVRDLDTTGRPARVGRFFRVSGMGDRGQGAGLALADLDGNGRPEMFVLTENDASGMNTFRYKIGWNLDADGQATRWTQMPEINGVAKTAHGAGIDVVDVDGNGMLDLVLMTYDDADGQNQFRYRIGFDMDSTGVPSAGNNPPRSAWRTDQPVNGLGHRGEGAGVVVRDMNADGRLDMVLMAYNAPNGPNDFRYKILWGLDQDGNTTSAGSWSRNLAGSRGDHGAGAGLDAVDLDGDGNLELILVAYNDPNGQNDFRMTVLFDPH